MLGLKKALAMLAAAAGGYLYERSAERVLY